MKQAYAALLWLYPASYRALFAREMVAVFEEARCERRPQGRAGYGLFLFAEFTSLGRGAGSEWLAEFKGRPGSPGRHTLSTTISLCCGLILTAVLQGFFYSGLSHKIRMLRASLASQPVSLGLMALATVCVVFIMAVLSVAFAINMKGLTKRRRR